MKDTMYNQLVQLNDKLKLKKQILKCKIDECNGEIEIIEQVMVHIENILTDEGKHSCEHYEEATNEKENKQFDRFFKS
ncbi:MAG: hypothetical protein K6G88_05745 [Lachnospiraceae bacterium]|nr:hypothetical protein [Lachnospiraceae bacterium]